MQTINKYKAFGPDRDGCTDLPEIDIAKWHALGGQDIVIWNHDWTVEATPAAFEYVRELYSLADITQC